MGPWEQRADNMSDSMDGWAGADVFLVNLPLYFYYNNYILVLKLHTRLIHSFFLKER